MSNFLLRSGPLVGKEFEPGKYLEEILGQTKVLVVGAGGLGCEILKGLVLSGFKNVHIIDMDTVDLTNLNRQFLFRDLDIGKPKSVVAAEFIKNRLGVPVVHYFGKIQDFDKKFYESFNLIICGLDSIEARRWMNSTIYQIYDPERFETTIPLIDGGTEGFKGQSRIIIPGKTSCYECSLDMLTKKIMYPICTIANTPRLPEHCVEWASVLEWPRVFPNRAPDYDDASVLTWIYNVALERAKMFNISGVTFSLTQGVVKNIIPAIASTNAIIAASCCNEALKMVSGCASSLDSYMMYTGDDGMYTFTFQHEKNSFCPVCSNKAIQIKFDMSLRLQDFIEFLKESPQFQCKKPSLRGVSKTLYMEAPPQLREETSSNLKLPLSELLETVPDSRNLEYFIHVTDPTIPHSITLHLSPK